ncbi:MAG TPA: PadR family transcriptional regulator [Anaerolineaceae bacterium]|nr:PadR family transcriptional regulator [Anaerolineaceae bacterium]
MSPMVRAPLTLEYALLGYIRQRSMYGYELHQLLTQPSGLGLVWQIKQSQLYALLDKLEKDGFLSVTLAESQNNRPSRKFFNLTPAGEQAFLAWLRQPVKQARGIRQEFLAKLYFSLSEDGATASALVHTQLETCRTWNASLEEELASRRGSPGFDEWVTRFRLQQVRGICAWLAELEESIDWDRGEGD